MIGGAHAFHARTRTGLKPGVADVERKERARMICQTIRKRGVHRPGQGQNMVMEVRRSGHGFSSSCLIPKRRPLGEFGNTISLGRRLIQ